MKQIMEEAHEDEVLEEKVYSRSMPNEQIEVIHHRNPSPPALMRLGYGGLVDGSLRPSVTLGYLTRNYDEHVQGCSLAGWIFSVAVCVSFEVAVKRSINVDDEDGSEGTGKPACDLKAHGQFIFKKRVRSRSSIGRNGMENTSKGAQESEDNEYIPLRSGAQRRTKRARSVVPDEDDD
jgi:hypothetical protein